MTLVNFNQPLQHNPKVSVVIPTFNRFKYLLNAINSVKQQTYKNIEIIIVNDCSTEENYYNFNFQKHFGEHVHIIHCPKRSRSMFGNVCGGGHARTIGMMFSEGNYISFLDDDDSFLPYKIEFQLKSLEQLNIKMSCTEALYGSGPMQSDTNYRNWHYEGHYWNNIKSIYAKHNKHHFIEEMFSSEVNIWNKDHIHIHNSNICSSIMFHKSLINTVGYFKLMGQGEDWDYWKRLSEYTDCAYIRTPLTYVDAAHGDGRNW
jgi:glycosyltransferase involved in cell wall biosynthesis